MEDGGPPSVPSKSSELSIMFCSFGGGGGGLVTSGCSCVTRSVMNNPDKDQMMQHFDSLKTLIKFVKDFIAAKLSSTLP